MRTSCQWNHLPKVFGDDSSVHRWFQRSRRRRRLREALGDTCGGMRRTRRRRLGVAGGRRLPRQGPLGGRNPTDRGRQGTKKSVVVERDGGPLGVTIAGANVHPEGRDLRRSGRPGDTKMLAETLDAIVVERPQPTDEAPQNLSLDEAFDNPTGREATESREYVPHIRRIGEEKPDENRRKRHPARRWVVERTISWLETCRAILVRDDANAQNCLGLLRLACALLWFRRLFRLANMRL